MSKEASNEKLFNMKVVEVGGQAVLGRQLGATTPWLTERHGYDPTLLNFVCELQRRKVSS